MGLLDKTLKSIKPLNKLAMEQARQRQDNLTKPRGSLGLLEALSVQIAGIQEKPLPSIKCKAIIIMAADHGVVSDGVSLYPQEVTRQMVYNFLNGGAAINVLAQQIGARVIVVDMGVIGGFPPTPGLICKMIDFGTRNMCLEPAMTRSQAINCLEAGIEVVENEVSRGLDILGTGDMGIGNTTAASAIIAAITGEPVKNIAGRGTGLNDSQLSHKIQIIEKALNYNRPDVNDAIDVLSKVGGFEIGGLAGAMIAGAASRIPVVVDGFISSSAALIATRLCPMVKDYLIAAHLSAEKGHTAYLNHMKVKPLLDFGMRLGEGTGAALGIFIAESAVNLLVNMSTFEQASVSDIRPG
jgi:nicotinate-nucleotide--dimethylbenzimidazole phosphoribosyltransferase